ncbi:peptidase associated/transthyretin-like domain-containing protein [Flavobacterium collinsii]|jgi:hypothetical protein|uniref:TonB-dependent receptor SusC n=1 Tax=Flavobacterium collinsii TaxID=1114861 RepID=A0ABM8KQ36_9FLAO|nr:hypothetical protein [Flavobacterium collinsii]CAA9203235.1 hypothetical protein FLACOL7796_04651 [Flavobacterium collinsii]
MKFKIITVFVLLFSLSITSLHAQEVKTIKGVVQNTNGSPLSGAVISVRETNQTVNSGSEGEFEIRIIKKKIH